jgi:2-polyprenyl-3-methyl-5-hydroxy-6-metoxy-1,4-benzoquinol methylase
MKDFYDKYLNTGFFEVNPPTRKAFDSQAKSYAYDYKKHFPKNKEIKILDVGCGMGHFLYFLKKEGYKNFVGIDISPQQIEFVKKKISDKVILGDIFDYLCSGETFDVIVMNDIIEHMNPDNLLKLLRLCYVSLNPDGQIFVKTVNMANPFSSRIRYIDITHQMGFTEESLKQILTIAGFFDLKVFGASYPIQSIGSVIGKLLEKIIYLIFREIVVAQGVSSSKIYNIDIIGIGLKK